MDISNFMFDQGYETTDPDFMVVRNMIEVAIKKEKDEYLSKIEKCIIGEPLLFFADGKGFKIIYAVQKEGIAGKGKTLAEAFEDMIMKNEQKKKETRRCSAKPGR